MKTDQVYLALEMRGQLSLFAVLSFFLQFFLFFTSFFAFFKILSSFLSLFPHFFLSLFFSTPPSITLPTRTLQKIFRTPPVLHFLSHSLPFHLADLMSATWKMLNCHGIQFTLFQKKKSKSETNKVGKIKLLYFSPSDLKVTKAEWPWICSSVALNSLKLKHFYNQQ